MRRDLEPFALTLEPFPPLEPNAQPLHQGALGLLNTSISTIVTRISTGDKVGGLMGVLDTSEKLAGVVGPSVGGVLYAYSLQPFFFITLKFRVE